MAGPEAGDRRVVGPLVRGDHAEGDVVGQLSLDPPRGALARGVGVEEKRDHHLGIVGGPAPAVRRDHAPLRAEELHRLADLSIDVHGPEYGPVLRAMILFTGYVGARIEEGCALEWPWIDFARSEVSILKAKFDKPRTVLMLPEAAEALRSMPRRTARRAPADHLPQQARPANRGAARPTTGPGTRSEPPSGRPCPSTVAARLSISIGTRCATSAAGTST